MKKVFKEFSKHYEFAEEFCLYLNRIINNTTSSKILEFITTCLRQSIPYDYVESEVWILLSSLSKYENIIPFGKMAIEKLQNHHSSDILKYGIYTYLSKLNDNRFIGFLAHEKNKLLLGFQIKNISSLIIQNPCFPKLLDYYAKRNSDTLNQFISRHLYFMAQYNEISQNKYDNFIKQLPQLNKQKFETINHCLRQNFDIDSDIDWNAFFKESFEHATAIFYHAHLAGKRHKSEWLNAIDSFNDLIMRAFIKNLNNWNPRQKTPSLTTNSRNGTIAKLIRNASDIHKRRCKNPLSHAIDEKTFQFTSFVKRTEFYELHEKEKIFLSEIIRIAKGYL